MVKMGTVQLICRSRMEKYQLFGKSYYLEGRSDNWLPKYLE